MDGSALRSALANLADCSSSLHWWFRFWTWWVVIGVALEIVFVIWEYIDDLHDCRRSLLRPPVRPNLLLFILGFLGAGLVAVGVAKELNVESKIDTLETCVRKGNDQLSLLLSTEAGNAATSATIARGEADAATLASGKAQKTANAANRTSGQAARKAESVGEKTDELARRAEELNEGQRKIAELQATAEKKEHELARTIDEYAMQLRARTIPEDPMIAKLKRLPPLNVKIWYQDGSEEIALFATGIASIFPFARWGNPQPKPMPSVVGELKKRFGSIGLKEYTLVRHSKESPSEKALYDALMMLGRGGGEAIDDSLPVDTVEIFVEAQIIGVAFPKSPPDEPRPKHIPN